MLFCAIHAEIVHPELAKSSWVRCWNLKLFKPRPSGALSLSQGLSVLYWASWVVTHLEVQAGNLADREIGIIALEIHPKIGCHRLAKKY